MRITIKDLQTGRDVGIDANGAALGRDAVRCQIVIADKSVSNLHAKIFYRDGRWFIEDQGSSNGSYMAGRRLSAATEIREGDEFTLFRYAFRVLHTDATGGATASLAAPDASSASTQMLPDAARLFPTERGTTAESGESEAHGYGHDAALAESTERTRDRDGRRSNAGVASGSVYTWDPASAGFMAVFMQGLDFYLKALPRLVLQPLATIRSATASPPVPAMTGLPLGAFAAPAFVMGGLAGGVAALVVSIIAHGSIVGSVISMLISMGIGVAAAVVSGFILHPVLGWLIRVLKGESDALTRTNYGVAAYAATMLVQIVGAIGVLLFVLPLPFLGIIGVTLSLGANLVVLYTAYVWLKYFGVVKWVPILVLVLMALSAVSSTRSLYHVVAYDIARLTSGGQGAGALAAAGVGETEATTVVPSAGLPGVPATADPGAKPAFIDRIKALFGHGSTGAASVTITGSSSSPGVAAGGVQAGASGVAGGVAVPGGMVGAGMPDSAGVTSGTSGAAGTASNPGSGVGLSGADAGGAQRTAYAEYQRRLDTIERAVAADPTLLIRAVGVRPLYKKLHSETARIQQKRAKAKGKPIAEDPYEDRLQQAQLYEATVAIVNELYVKAVEQPVFAAGADTHESTKAKKKTARPRRR